MNWTDGPATWKQLRYLSQHGYKPDRVLTKAEASELIRKFGGDPDTLAIVAAIEPPRPAQPETAHQLRVAAEKAKRAVADSRASEIGMREQDYALALSRRRDFWVHSCSEMGKVSIVSVQAQELYQKHGCRFVAPSPKQAQHILEALDSAMPSWDKDHPELFFETLQINFPELVRRR